MMNLWDELQKEKARADALQAVLWLTLEALRNHTAQTRPIEQTRVAINAAQSLLDKPKGAA